MALSQKSVPTLETEASFLKSWDLPSTRNAIPRSLSDKKKPYMFLEMAGQKVKKEVEPLVFVTDGLDNKDDIHDISINLETDRRFNIDEEIMMKQAPLPYLHYRNEKKIFHTPFKWIFNQAQTQQINSESFYVIREVVVSDDTGAKQGDRYYQIQPDRLKIEEMREQIDTAFQLYWKLTMYNRIRTNFSVEINNLQKSLQEVFRKISIEEDYNYDSNSYILFTNNNIDEQTYKEYYSLLEPMISAKMIPVLAKLKNELYAMAYLSGEYNDIRTDLNLFLHNLNQTIAISGMMKKTADKISTLSFLGLREELELAKLQNPQDLYKSFQKISVRIQALTHDANRFSKLRIGFRTYLKAAVILDIYLSNEFKLVELKKKLCLINEQLSQKAQQMKEKGYLRRIGSISAGPDYFIEDFDIDFKSILEGSQCLDQSTVREMKDHTQRVESFVKLAEIFCEEIKSTKDHVKVFKMHYDSVLYLQQVEQVLRGISLAKDIKEKLDPMLEEQEEGSESLQQDLVRQFEKDNRELVFQIRQSSCSIDNQSWCSPKVAAALMKALDQELQGKKGNKGQIKAVTFGKRKMFGKLAKIIRRRTRQKNKIYISCRKRVYSQIKIRDAFEFLKSKRLWRAVSSEKSCMISVQGNIEGRKKAVNHKIYCNSELEMNLMKIIRVFVFFLADAMPTV